MKALSFILFMFVIVLVATAHPGVTLAQSASTPNSNLAQQQRIKSDLQKQIDLLQVEANYTESKKEFLPESEYQAIISEIQSYIQRINQIITNADQKPYIDSVQEFTRLKISSHVLRAVRLRRTAALLITYQKSLQNYQSVFTQLQSLLGSHQLSSKAAQLNTCSNQLETQLTDTNKYLTGLFSQIGLIYSVDAPQAKRLSDDLRNQMNEGKRSLDLVRKQVRLCLDEIKP